jgi:NADPH:quinone reductase-like Zn-dependent oxidoreductase
MPAVGDDDLLIRVHASSVNPLNFHGVTGKPFLVRLLGFGLFKPKRATPGSDVAGRIEAVGRNVTQFQPGEEVFGAIGGAYAEYVCGSADGVVLKPANLTFEQAAAVPGAGITALQGLRDKGQIRPGHRVLINGASGGVGTFAVQIAKAFGAEVTGVCSTRNVAMVRSIGADHVIDYTQDDFTRVGERYDLMLDAVGSRSLSDCKRALSPDGTYVALAGPENSLGALTRAATILLVSRFGSHKMVPLMARVNKEDLGALKELIEAGDVTPVIDRRYTLSEAPEALRYQGEGHAQGKTVITV